MVAEIGVLKTPRQRSPHESSDRNLMLLQQSSNRRPRITCSDGVNQYPHFDSTFHGPAESVNKKTAGPIVIKDVCGEGN